MQRLGWNPRELYLAALNYGDVGSLHDVQEHLRTGDHLSPEQKYYLATALRDAELDATKTPTPTGTPSLDVVAAPQPSV